MTRWMLLVIYLGLMAGVHATHAQLDMTGTLGEPCFGDGSCMIGLACNEAGLCENSGRHGQLA